MGDRGGVGQRRRRRAGERSGRPGFAAGRCLMLVAMVLALTLVARQPAEAQATAGQTLTAEEQLAQKYAPIAYLKRQEFPCDPEGEPWLPAPVEIDFGDREVALRQAPGAVEVKRGIDGADLFGQDASHYIDLPGNPREPGCGYERHARERMAGQSPVVYAHIAKEPGQTGLGLQYWFYYYFNDFNDKHESDWEMIQLAFDADSAAEALTQEPVSTAFSQHKGGETAAWNGGKLRKEDGHPVTYPSRGSHGNYYAPGVWLGWGENRSGLGCDNTTGPSIRVAPEVRLVPDEVSGPDDPFAWSRFGGTWGQREAWVYDGPRGPNLNARWRAPIAWAEGLRDSSLRLDAPDALGPAPTAVFCTAVETLSDLYTQLKVYPAIVVGGLAALLALAGWLIYLAESTLSAAWGIYSRHLGTFVAIGAVLIPAGLIANGVHYLLVTNPPVETLVAVTEKAPFVPLILGLTLGNFQHLVSLIFVGPAVIEAVADIRAGRAPSFRRAYAAVFSDFRALLGAGLRVVGVVAGLTLTVVGLPWAVFWGVRWAFIGQAVILDDAGAGRAPAVSAGVVRGHWGRTLAIVAVLVFVAAVLGPLIGIPLMILVKAPLDLVNGLSGVVYAFSHPFAVIGGTLLYEQLRGAEGGE